jgi:putative Ca2+/H+ antiporter (TMEM165/GDT1 family)
MVEIIAGVIFLVIGILSVIYNRRSARNYAETWGRRLKHGYAIGRLVSIFGGILFLLFAVLLLFVKRN